MKMDWLVTNVTAVRCPDIAKHDSLGMILNVLWPIQAIFVVREPLCDGGDFGLFGQFRQLLWPESHFVM